MAKINLRKVSEPIFTHEGARAVKITPEKQLRRSVMACLLWEDQFYEDGMSIADRISQTIPLVAPDKVANIAVVARDRMKLRHMPLFIARVMANLPEHKKYVSSILPQIIQRADELSEFLAIYWKDGKQPISAQVKKGLAMAFNKFDEYQLAKYNRENEIKLKDVLFLCHPNPIDIEQAMLWKRLINDELEVPDTWEVSLSAGKDKKETFERLMRENKLGALALLRNLRNMSQSGVSKTLIYRALESMNVSRVLPFRFITAAQHCPEFEDGIEKAFFKCAEGLPKLGGKTVVIVDVSGSMYGATISEHSESTRVQVASALAMLTRELCEDVSIYATAGNDGTRKHATGRVPARRGFALADVIQKKELSLGGGGIFLKQCLDFIQPLEKTADRIIVITDEQDCDLTYKPEAANAFGKFNYMINVGSYKNGIGYSPKWTHIDGWSEAVLDYIKAVEELENTN